MKIRTGSLAIASLVCSLFAGCSSSHDGDVLNPAMGDLQGTWEYLVTNAYSATFTDCTGDAAILEGATLYQGMSMAPICLTPVSFAVTQNGDAFDVVPHPVVCSDGAAAAVTGFGQIANPTVGGQWESTSDQGVSAVQLFTGVISGNTIQLTEMRRTFSGGFDGACDFSPPLTALITVQ